MASSSISPYRNSANTVVFQLVSTTATGAKYIVSGRDIACPYSIDINRKLTQSSATGNDHVQIRVARVERNATTQKLATCQAVVDISLPKDTSILTAAIQTELLNVMTSVFRDATASAATNANITALIEGRDL